MVDTQHLVLEPEAVASENALSRLAPWKQWLQKKGFKQGRGESRYADSDVEWNREWRDQGRGWRVQVVPDTLLFDVNVYNNPLRYGRAAFRFQVDELKIPKTVGALIREIERPVSDQSKKRRLKALEKPVPPVAMESRTREAQKNWIPSDYQIDDEFGCLTNAENLAKRVPELRYVEGFARFPGKEWGSHAWCVAPGGQIVDPCFQAKFPRTWRKIEYRESDRAFDRHVAEAGIPHSAPIPDPEELTPEQLRRMLNQVKSRCFPLGTRVRVRRDQSALNDLEGTVVDAGPYACYVALDAYVEADDPDPFRLTPDELEVLKFPGPLPEAQESDLDTPTPYLAAMDWYEPLKALGYVYGEQMIPGSYRKQIHPCNFKGQLRLWVSPSEELPAANIYIDYRHNGEYARIINTVVPAIKVMDAVRELEQLACDERVQGISDYARILGEKGYPGCEEAQRNHLLYLFGESLDDTPERYLGELQRHAEVIEAFQAQGCKLRRRPTENDPFYILSWSDPGDAYNYDENSQVGYSVFLEPFDQGLAVSAEGNKYFFDEKYGSIYEAFDIPKTWTIPSEITGEVLDEEVAQIVSDIKEFKGPSEPTIPERDYEDDDRPLEEGVDDITDLKDYAVGSADYTPLDLISAKQLRQAARNVGFRINSIFRSKRTAGWVLRMVPVTDEVVAEMRRNAYWMDSYLYGLFQKELMKFLPGLTGESAFLNKIHLHFWMWHGAPLNYEEDPKKWVIYGDIKPADSAEREQRYALNRTRRKKKAVAEAEAEAETEHGQVPVREALDPDDPQAFLQRTHVAQLGDTVTQRCPHCGHQWQVIKNWSDNMENMGVSCSQCGEFVKFGANVVVDSVADPANAPDDPDKTLAQQGEPDLNSYIETTLSLAHFLAEQGWVKSTDDARYGECWQRDWPAPQEYRMGQLVFNRMRVRIAFNPSAENPRGPRRFAARVMLRWVLPESEGMMINQWTLVSQLVYPEARFDQTPEESRYDRNMPVRRFASGVEAVLYRIHWPENPAALFHAQSQLETEMTVFVKDLNRQADLPLQEAVNFELKP